jgi:hypothetical protein
MTAHINKNAANSKKDASRLLDGLHNAKNTKPDRLQAPDRDARIDPALLGKSPATGATQTWTPEPKPRANGETPKAMALLGSEMATPRDPAAQNKNEAHTAKRFQIDAGLGPSKSCRLGCAKVRR